MSGERRTSPELQVRAALEEAKRQGVPFEEAWQLATRGNVCDSYSSARSRLPVAQDAASSGAPPSLRPADGFQRCAGCRHVVDAGNGPARCGLYQVPVYCGVLWPHRTDDRVQWRNALLGDPDDPEDAGTVAEWAAAYDGRPSTTSGILDVIARYLAGQDRESLGDAQPAHGPEGTGGSARDRAGHRRFGVPKGMATAE